MELTLGKTSWADAKYVIPVANIKKGKGDKVSAIKSIEIYFIGLNYYITAATEET